MAIDDLLDEHEQSERVRSWLRKNGASILGGVVIAIGAIAGWQWYQKDQGGKLASANVEYQKALVGLQQNKLDDAAKAVKALEAGLSSIYGDRRRCSWPRPVSMPARTKKPRYPARREG